ncbi:hypothetical protein [Nocardia thailandica]
MTRMVGYYQSGHVGRDRLVVEHRLRQYALASGAPLSGLYAEAAPQQNPLWSLLASLDHRHGTALLDSAGEHARRDGIDLATLRYQAVPQQFWRAVADLQAAGGGYLVIPHPGHLDHLGTPRRVLLDHLAATDPRIGLLDASTSPSAPGRDTGGARIGEFSVVPVDAAVEIAQISTRRHLAQNGLADLIPRADALVHALVGSLIEPSHARAQDLRLSILLTCHDTGISVRCWDTRAYAEVPVPPTVVDACHGGRISRSPSGEGTVTVCELPSPAMAAAPAPARPDPGPVTVRAR